MAMLGRSRPSLKLHMIKQLRTLQSMWTGGIGRVGIPVKIIFFYKTKIPQVT